MKENPFLPGLRVSFLGQKSNFPSVSRTHYISPTKDQLKPNCFAQALRTRHRYVAAVLLSRAVSHHQRVIVCECPNLSAIQIACSEDESTTPMKTNRRPELIIRSTGGKIQLQSIGRGR